MERSGLQDKVRLGRHESIESAPKSVKTGFLSTIESEGIKTLVYKFDVQMVNEQTLTPVK